MSDAIAINSEIPPPAINADYMIRLEFFQGPMDLLLHLVARQEVSVEEVKMSEIAEQYLRIVTSSADRLDLEKAGEYLVIASTLLAIKSKALLPIEADDDEQVPGDWNEENPFFEDLRARLKAYHQTQQQAELLRKLPQLNVDTFVRRDRKLLQPTSEMLQEPEDVFSLGAMFLSLMKRIGASSTFSITAQPFAVVDFMVSIVDSLKIEKTSVAEVASVKKKVSFSALLRLLRGTSRKGSNRTIVIGGFIAVLELMKRGLVSAEFSDTEHFSVDLAMESVSEDTAKEFSSEFDEETKEEPQEGANVVHIDDYRAESRSSNSPADSVAKHGTPVDNSEASVQESELDKKVVGLSNRSGE